MKVIVAQKGAREHFLAARALNRHGMLVQLLVDWYAPHSRLGRTLFAALGRKAVASALAACCDEIPQQLVRSFPCRSLFWKWKVRRMGTTGRAFEGFDQTDAAFARAATRLPLPPHDVFLGYSYASLELLEFEKKRGVFTVLDQIDPGPVEYRLVAEEMARRPELAGPPAPFPKNHFDRARREWNLADMIVVNSEWTQDAIISDGAPAEKVEVIPLCYEKNERNVKSEIRNRKPDQPLRVLFLGQVNVRKGIHHLIEAARRLVHEPVEFLIAGHLDIRREVVAKAPGNMRWMGAVPRGQVSELYQQSDVFVLPTLSDGFAITQLEAMAHGLPVIVTPNCGRVVEDGITGFVVPVSDPASFAHVILSLIQQPELLDAMRPNCVVVANTYSIGSYGQRLLQAIQRRKRAARDDGARPALAGCESVE
jgi:glycosyltransferase involved in cell wall biosynthesis